MDVISNEKYKLSKSSGSLTNESSLSNLMFKKDTKLKVGNLLTSSFITAAIIVSILFSFFQKEKRILTFTYSHLDNQNYNFISINLEMFYIFLILIILANSFLVYLFVTYKNSQFSKIIYSELKFNLILTQLFVGIIFLIGILLEKNYVSLISSVTLNILTILNLCFYYKSIRAKTNLSIKTFITIYCYTSVMLSFMTYLTFFNIGEILLNGIDMKDPYYNVIKVTCSIISQSVILLISIILISHVRDVIYSFTFSYFLIGNLVCCEYLETKEIISCSIVLFFNLTSIALTIYKYGKSTFGFNTSDFLNEEDTLIHRSYSHKKSSWFNVGGN
jgi:hypothetical protein